MAALELPAAAPWPPQPLKTERLTLRAPQTSDQPWLVELFTSPQARRFLGGPLPLVDAQKVCSGPFGRTPGSFVVIAAASGDFVGTIGFDRRDADRPGHLAPGDLEPELSYVLSPPGSGARATPSRRSGAALTWAAESPSRTIGSGLHADGQHSLAALLRRLGFDDTDQTVLEFDADQSLWVRSLPPVETPPPALTLAT